MRGLAVARSAVNESVTATKDNYEALSDGGEDAEGDSTIHYPLFRAPESNRSRDRGDARATG